MSNLISIEELRKEFLEKNKPADLKEFVEKQQLLLEKYMRLSASLQEQLNHANDVIKNMGSNLTIKTDSNDEEFICIEQISILKERSRTKELDINDVKKLDLLIKNLRLIREQSTSKVDTAIRDVSEIDLLAIAKGD